MCRWRTGKSLQRGKLDEIRGEEPKARETYIGGFHNEGEGGITLLLRVGSGMPLRATRISAHHGISQAQHFITQHYLLCSVRTTTRDFLQIAQNLSHRTCTTSALLFTITTATSVLEGIFLPTHFPDPSFRRLFSLTLIIPTYCVQLFQNFL